MNTKHLWFKFEHGSKEKNKSEIKRGRNELIWGR